VILVKEFAALLCIPLNRQIKKPLRNSLAALSMQRTGTHPRNRNQTKNAVMASLFPISVFQDILPEKKL
jgi:hypothetical protein